MKLTKLLMEANPRFQIPKGAQKGDWVMITRTSADHSPDRLWITYEDVYTVRLSYNKEDAGDVTKGQQYSTDRLKYNSYYIDMKKWMARGDKSVIDKKVYKD